MRACHLLSPPPKAAPAWSAFCPCRCLNFPLPLFSRHCQVIIIASEEELAKDGDLVKAIKAAAPEFRGKVRQQPEERSLLSRSKVIPPPLSLSLSFSLSLSLSL